MAIAGGVKDLPWLFSGTFVAMLLAVPAFSALAARLPRHRFIPLCYRFFVVLLLGFWAVFALGLSRVGATRAFFIVISVYNLFVVSIFWSFLADIFRHGQADSPRRDARRIRPRGGRINPGGTEKRRAARAHPFRANRDLHEALGLSIRALAELQLRPSPRRHSAVRSPRRGGRTTFPPSFLSAQPLPLPDGGDSGVKT